MPATLPAPDPIAKAHSDKLLALIQAEIADNGPMSFQRYMDLALYANELGYYTAGAHKFGRAGDFVTAPEISSLFSRCVAKQCQQVLASLDSADMLELGAGSGVMALHLLEELERQQALPAHYYILEVSPDLQQRQRLLFAEKRPDLLEKVSWLHALPATPFNGVIVANEVMDAMPVHLFHVGEGVQELCIDHGKQGLHFTVQPTKQKLLIESVNALGVDFAPGYQSEINLLLPAWIQSLSECLAKGLILLIDYGFPRHEYYHPDRHRGTVMCHYQHHAHDNPLIWPGIQDITAHVDFTAVAETAVNAGLAVSGFTHQAAFLINCKIAQMLEIVDEVERFQLSQQVKTLTLPSEMGELFKAIALTKNFDDTLLGFKQLDQRARL